MSYDSIEEHVSRLSACRLQLCWILKLHDSIKDLFSLYNYMYYGHVLIGPHAFREQACS